jgi:hypothetical protein
LWILTFTQLIVIDVYSCEQNLHTGMAV